MRIRKIVKMLPVLWMLSGIITKAQENASMLLPQKRAIKVEMAEFWIDDSSQHSMIEIVDNGQLSFAVDTKNVNDGLHTLYYRVRDDDGMYSQLYSWKFIRTHLQENSQANRVESLEYWFDADTMHVSTISIDNNTVDFAVDASILNPGLHTLSYRAKDLSGNYSSPKTWFFVRNVHKGTKIAWCKYWWNNHEDKAVVENMDSTASSFTFSQQLEVPIYAKTDGWSANSTARFHIVFGDDAGNVSRLEWADVTYPDDIAPVSIIEAEEEVVAAQVRLKWWVENDQVKDYNIYYSEDNEPFVLWLPNTTKQTAIFRGQPTKTYRFTVTARDKAGNQELFNEDKFAKTTFTGGVQK